MTRTPEPRSPRETILGMFYLPKPGDPDAPLFPTEPEPATEPREEEPTDE